MYTLIRRPSQKEGIHCTLLKADDRKGTDASLVSESASPYRIEERGEETIQREETENEQERGVIA